MNYNNYESKSADHHVGSVTFDQVVKGYYTSIDKTQIIIERLRSVLKKITGVDLSPNNLQLVDKPTDKQEGYIRDFSNIAELNEMQVDKLALIVTEFESLF